MTSTFCSRKFYMITVLAWAALGTTDVLADVITTFNGTISLDVGTDTLGLDGATFTFTASFADGSTWTGSVSSPILLADTHSLTISGSTSGDGTFTDNDGFRFGYTPVAGGHLHMHDAAGRSWTSSQPTGPFRFDHGTVRNWNVGITVPGFGDPVVANNWAASDIDFQFRVESGDIPKYSLVGGGSFEFSASAVPEPSSLGLVVMLTVAVVSLQRRWKRVT